VPGTSLSFGSLIEQLSAAGVARFMWPERLELVEALPRNPTGKVLKGELVRLLLAANGEATRTGVG